MEVFEIQFATAISARSQGLQVSVALGKNLPKINTM
jgi:hypothetical protein